MIVTYMSAFLCVLGLAIGQILFKQSAIYLQESGSFFSLKTSLTLVSAILLYGVTSIAWVWILQRVELGKVYPIMALAFVLVPIGSYFVFGERFQLNYFIGMVLVIAGIIIASKA